MCPTEPPRNPIVLSGYDPIAKQKAPKNFAEGISFISTALKDFGITGLSLRPLVDFLKQALGNSNATVRASATAALVTLKLFAGSGTPDFNIADTQR